MGSSVSHRHREVIERICQAVRKTAVDEERHAKEQWQRIFLAGKRNHSGHDKATSDSQQSRTPRPDSKASLENLLRRSTQVNRRQTGKQRHQKASHNVTRKDKQQLTYGTCHTAPTLFIAQGHKTCGTRIQRQLIAHHREQTKREQHSTYNIGISQVAPAGNADSYTRENG